MKEIYEKPEVVVTKLETGMFITTSGGGDQGVSSLKDTQEEIAAFSLELED